MGELLTSEGYIVELANDGQPALDLLRASPQGLVTLLDVMMPALNGVEVLRAVAADPALAQRHGFIIMTASAISDYEDLPELVRQFNAPVLIKPFSIEALLAAVSAVAARLRH